MAVMHPSVRDGRIDPAELIDAVTHALINGSADNEDADFDTFMWGFHLADVFGNAGAKVIGMLQLAFAEQDKAMRALEARLADIEQSQGGRRQPFGTRMVGDLVQWVAQELNLRVADIRGEGRHTTLLTARQLVVCCARRIIPDCSYPKIGRALGGRDHTTIMSAERRAEMRATVDPEFRELRDRMIVAFQTKDEDRIAAAYPERKPDDRRAPR